MALTADQVQLVSRIATRLRSTEEGTYRAGGRAVALQAIEHRVDLVPALRSAIAELGESPRNDHQRGYHEALLDVLVAAEAALEPRIEEDRARRALASTPILQQVLDRVAPKPVTPGEIAKEIGKSPASAGRYFLQLRRLGLIAEIPSASDARERPHCVTPTGARLVQRRASPPARAPRRSAAPVANAQPVAVRAAPAEAVSIPYREFGERIELDHDPATGLRLLDSFQQLLASQLELHRKAQLPLTIMRIDICQFHEFTAHADFVDVNKLILRVAQVLKNELTATAEVARYDWDKFVVMLPQQPVGDAQKLAAVLLSKLAPVTANIGIAGDDATNVLEPETLLRASEAALRHAKAEGLAVATRSPILASV